MPGIFINNIEDDGNGGWYVQWTDPENLDGFPLTAYFHLTEATLQELKKQRELLGAPTDNLDQTMEALAMAQAEGPSFTEDGLAMEVQTWVNSYDEILTDTIDRVNYGLKPDAPHWALEALRNEEEVPPEFLRDHKEEFTMFVDNHKNIEISFGGEVADHKIQPY